MPSTLEPLLPDFVAYVEQQHLIISDGVPPQYMEHFLRHELWCLGVFADRHDSCVEALKLELGQVPADQRGDYQPYRKDFYRRLVRYYVNKSTPTDKELRILVKASLGLGYLTILGAE